MPRRVVNGVDSSRVAMLLAVLERRSNMQLSTFDVYVSTVGGIRVTEPGADLAIALEQGIRDVDRVLLVHEGRAAFEHARAHGVRPDRQPRSRRFRQTAESCWPCLSPWYLARPPENRLRVACRQADSSHPTTC